MNTNIEKELKKAQTINEERTRHQIQFLGLVENVRVRRAGFAYRRDFTVFVNRYSYFYKPVIYFFMID